MNTLSYKTVSANKATVTKEWVLIDATNQPVGRLASQVSKMLRGKHRANYTPNVDCGDNVIVINAEKVRLTGKKLTDRQYVKHTGYPGGQRHFTAKDMLSRVPEQVEGKPLRRERMRGTAAWVIEHAVKGMLPKNRLSSDLFSNLYVYTGNQHPHEAQNPKQIDLSTFK
ncbi:MAG: 50S ribosomal protein L13 [Bacteroidales bacterium]|nr:50S ribosomal protein L13 [Bacteroidales bacterium]